VKAELGALFVTGWPRSKQRKKVSHLVNAKHRYRVSAEEKFESPAVESVISITREHLMERKRGDAQRYGTAERERANEPPPFPPQRACRRISLVSVHWRKSRLFSASLPERSLRAHVAR
jgi:hypothetical protein